MAFSVFKIQHFCTNDGPGIRTTVFFKGCPLKCIWCHNPEGISQKSDLGFFNDKCINCRRCESICTYGVHTFDKVHIINRLNCVGCKKCEKECPVGALEIHGSDMSIEEIIEEAAADRIFYGDSGGITLSGGEPFAQGEKLLELLKALKEQHISVCIETCGYTNSDLIKKSVPMVDLFLYDIKETDEKRHKAFTGVGLERIMSNLELLNSLGANVILRCPIIPNCNDRHEHLKSIANIAISHPCVLKVELEPYHSLGLGKYSQLGIVPDYKEHKSLNPSALKDAFELIRQMGVSVTVNGNELV